MRVLVGKTFGIGNSILSIPMIKALRSLGHRVDVLIGTGPDDFGAEVVMKMLRESSDSEIIGNVWKDGVPFNVEPHDYAIMAIPYDGRWQNGVHFFAKKVLDGRKRPGNVDRLGFDMWEKHEVEYQMENARELGYSGATPDCSFMPTGVQDPDLVYVGLGYKRDPGGFGRSKHFGNERYAELLTEIRRMRPNARFVSTGGAADMTASWFQIIKLCGQNYSEFYRFPMLDLKHSFDLLSGCAAYIGNDTGMMHAAASTGMPTMALMAYPDLAVKNPPFCEKSQCIVFSPTAPTVHSVAEQFVDFVWG